MASVVSAANQFGTIRGDALRAKRVRGKESADDLRGGGNETADIRGVARD